MMISDSLPPMMCLISSRADLTLKSQCVMSDTPPDETDIQFNCVVLDRWRSSLIFSRYSSNVSCVVTGTGALTTSFSSSSFSDRVFQWCSFAHPWLHVILSSLWSSFCCLIPFASVFVHFISSHQDNITNVMIASFSGHILRRSCPHFSRHVVRVGVLFWSVLVVTLGLWIWCWWSPRWWLKVWRRVLFCVQRSFTSETSTRRDRRHSSSSVCLSFRDPWTHVVQLHRTVRDWFFHQSQSVVRIQTSRLSKGLRFSSDLLRCDLAVVLVRFSHACIQDTFTVTDLMEVCSAMTRPRYFILHHTFSVKDGPISADHSIPTWMLNALSLSFGEQRTTRVLGIRSGCPLSDSRIILTFVSRVLIADPFSQTTTASDDEFSIPTNIPGKNRGIHFSSSSHWLDSHVQNLLHKFQDRCVAPSFIQSVRRCRNRICSFKCKGNSATKRWR